MSDLFGAQLGDYLSQFYTNGPYLHSEDNDVPYKAAFFADSAHIETKARIDAFDGIIRQMEANEAAFYADMGVADITAFNNKYMLGKQLLEDAKNKVAASDIKGNFYQKIQYLILVPLRNILYFELKEEDVRMILDDVFIKDPKFRQKVEEMVVTEFHLSLADKKVQEQLKNSLWLIIQANLLSSSAKSKYFSYSGNFVEMRETYGLIRRVMLKELNHTNPILTEQLNK